MYNRKTTKIIVQILWWSTRSSCYRRQPLGRHFFTNRNVLDRNTAIPDGYGLRRLRLIFLYHVIVFHPERLWRTSDGRARNGISVKTVCVKIVKKARSFFPYRVAKGSIEPFVATSESTRSGGDVHYGVTRVCGRRIDDFGLFRWIGLELPSSTYGFGVRFDSGRGEEFGKIYRFVFITFRVRLKILKNDKTNSIETPTTKTYNTPPWFDWENKQRCSGREILRSIVPLRSVITTRRRRSKINTHRYTSSYSINHIRLLN